MTLDPKDTKGTKVVNMNVVKDDKKGEVPEFVRVAFLIGLSAFLSYLAKEIDSLVRNVK